MMVWMRAQPPAARARAINALARAFAHAAIPGGVRNDAILAMTTALDDPSALVRRSLAEGLASAANAPPHILLALAGDVSEVARVVVAHSPRLDDAALAEAARCGDAAVQTAIARRPDIGSRAVFALAEIGERAAALALVGNRRAALDPEALRLLFDRFADDAQIRAALGARENLSAALRIDLAVANIADRFSALEPRRRARKLSCDARDAAAVEIARDCCGDELMAFVEHLRQAEYLTPAVLLRSLLAGETTLVEATLAHMSGTPLGRAAGLVRQWRGQGFAALYGHSGLPEVLLPAFRAALDALATGSAPAVGAGVSHALTLRVIEACEALADPRLAPAIAMMWRLAGDSAREEARLYVDEFTLSPPPAPAPALALAPPVSIDPVPAQPGIGLADAAPPVEALVATRAPELAPPPAEALAIEITAVGADPAAANSGRDAEIQVPSKSTSRVGVFARMRDSLFGRKRSAGDLASVAARDAALPPEIDIAALEAAIAGLGAEASDTDPVMPGRASVELELDGAGDEPQLVAAAPAGVGSAPEAAIEPVWADLLEQIERPELDPASRLPSILEFEGANENHSLLAEDVSDGENLADAA